jgi:two-component system response regulator PilR (NtrC family)
VTPDHSQDAATVAATDTAPAAPLRALVVDDEDSLRETTRLMLTRAGYAVSVAADVPEGHAAIADSGERGFDLILTDLHMPGGSGLDVLRAARAHDPSTQVVLMTAFGSVGSAVEAMKAGAYDYIEKPFKKDALLALLEKAAEKRALLCENFWLKRALASEQGRFEQIVGRSRAMRQMFDLIQRAAPARTTVLITGESGTGKELVARAIHQRSGRKGTFVAVNCGAIPESLIESELFGHLKGTFTGAIRDKTGLFAAAHGGTLFLDEVGELPLPMQVKLLRALQERRIQPIGSVQEQPIDVRVVAATNRDLAEEVAQRRFREDLYFRLNVIQLRVPALRERRDDIPLLIEHFLRHFCDEHGKAIQGIHADALALLLAYNYPGNVRELENIIERAVTLALHDLITPDVLPYPMLQQENLHQASLLLDIPADGIDLEAVVAKLEESLLRKALQRTGGNRTEAARLLKISFRSIRYRLAKYNLAAADDDAPADASD